MIDVNLVWIISLVLIAAITAILIVTGIISYKMNNNEKYSFLKHFPHELSYKDSPNRRRHLVFIFIYVFMFYSILWNTLPFITEFKSFAGLVVVEALFAVVTSLSFLAINIVEAKYVRQHTLVATLYMAGSFGMVMMTGVFSVLLFTINRSSSSLTVGVFSFLLAILQILVILNPRLKDWAKLDSKRSDSGEITYSRPKLFPLAYSEWLTFIISTLGLILFLFAII